MLTAAPEKITDHDLSHMARVLAERLRRIADRQSGATATSRCPTCGARRIRT